MKNHKYMKEKALQAAGIPGSVVGHRKGSKVHKDKRKAQRQGQVRHPKQLMNAEDD